MSVPDCETAPRLKDQRRLGCGWPPGRGAGLLLTSAVAEKRKPTRHCLCRGWSDMDGRTESLAIPFRGRPRGMGRALLLVFWGVTLEGCICPHQLNCILERVCHSACPQLPGTCRPFCPEVRGHCRRGTCVSLSCPLCPRLASREAPGFPGGARLLGRRPGSREAPRSSGCAL